MKLTERKWIEKIQFCDMIYIFQTGILFIGNYDNPIRETIFGEPTIKLNGIELNYI